MFDRLRRALAAHGADLVIYDLSPGLSLLERSVLMSVNEVVLPALAEYFSVDGSRQAGGAGDTPRSRGRWGAALRNPFDGPDVDTTRR